VNPLLRRILTCFRLASLRMLDLRRLVPNPFANVLFILKNALDQSAVPNRVLRTNPRLAGSWYPDPWKPPFHQQPQYVFCIPTISFLLPHVRTRVKNELQHLMLNQGMQKKQKLWSTEGRAALASLPLEPWTDRRRKDLLHLLAMLDVQLESLNDAVTQVARDYPGVPLLMSQPGVGAVTALAFVLTLGDVHRFPRGKQVASYLGLIPREHSSGGKQRMGGISKQGNRLLRFLLVEAANIAVRFDPELRKEYLHRCHQKHFTVAKVATARKLAIRMYWMLRTQTPYPQVLSSRVA
jgi:transposase